MTMMNQPHVDVELVVRRTKIRRIISPVKINNDNDNLNLNVLTQDDNLLEDEVIVLNVTLGNMTTILVAKEIPTVGHQTIGDDPVIIRRLRDIRVVVETPPLKRDPFIWERDLDPEDINLIITIRVYLKN